MALNPLITGLAVVLIVFIVFKIFKKLLGAVLLGVVLILLLWIGGFI